MIEIHGESGHAFVAPRNRNPNLYSDYQAPLESIEQADAVLREIAREASTGGCYDKTFFTITLCNGEEYKGRIDIHHESESQETSTGELSLLLHISDHLRFSLGLAKPAHMSAATYADHVQLYSDEQKTAMRNWAQWLGICLS